MRRCFIDRAVRFEHHGDKFTVDHKYIGCFEPEGDNCAAPILQHLIALMKRFKRHIEEAHKKLGE